MYEYIENLLVKVKVIRSKGQGTLVEWSDSGRTRRTIVPRDVVRESEKDVTYVEETDLSMGIPYGVNWEARLKKSYTVTGAKLAEQLEVVGIWTKEDYDKNPAVVQQAVLGAARELLTELYAIARQIPIQED